ncbi:F0F1 ATP synthase subunit epsilon [Methylomonas koyamae]|uniref:ATP synthase epsilon chain n=1 Tax=Methylomonas koyamae TaxID=702114 RepID=A0A291IJY0_9GAMM|nr:F0F1 ATP synthase subunit epsilon [Methylomonas koyamae]ATG90612.1 F0F1 ATP synthase subunit epsilon [Methylomonas koyamae]OAI28369.1 hypothetical protein A1356_07285 [Methylomonas koyamae]
MSGFSLTLFDSRGVEYFEQVGQFVGADADGSFGILPGHVGMVALLRYGLARFRDQAGAWHYLALPGGVLRFSENRMTLTAVRYFLGDDPDAICELLAAEMARIDSEVHRARATLTEIERSLLRRLAELSNRVAGGR